MVSGVEVVTVASRRTFCVSRRSSLPSGTWPDFQHPPSKPVNPRQCVKTAAVSVLFGPVQTRKPGRSDCCAVLMA